jgi:hypothetical protein
MSSWSSSSSSKSVGGFGGVKKLKKDSVGTVRLTTRVCLVSFYELLACESHMLMLEPTLVALLLALDADGKVLTLLPVDLVTLGVVVDEISAVSVLVLVVVGLGDLLVREELVFLEDEVESESRGVEVAQPDVGEVLKSVLVTLSDSLGKENVVLHGGQPELRDTLHLLSGDLLLLLGLFLIVGLLVLLSGGDLLLSGLSGTVNDGGTLLVERSELGEILLLELENLLLELSLELGVLLLDTTETGDTALNVLRKGLNVSGRTSDKLAELSLDHGDKRRVRGEDGSGSSAVKLLCEGQTG